MSGTHRLTVLLVEDNPGDARYIEELLREASELSARVMSNEDAVRRGHEATAGRSYGETTPGSLGASTAGTGGPTASGNDGGLGARSEEVAPELVHETRLADGLERLREGAIDVVLLDLNLPDSEGIETLTTAAEATDVPVVVLTGVSDRSVGRRALREGADEYLVKDEINSDLLVRSLYHAMERREHERELKRHEVLVEESTDVNAVLGADGTFRFLTPSVESVLGYAPEELIGENAFERIHPDDVDAAAEEFGRVLEGGELVPMEFRYEHADGSWVVLEARGRDLRDDPLVDGVVLYSRDVTERKRREEQLAQQREELAALNQLNGVVQELTHAIIESTTRTDLEESVCRRLAGTDAYLFAWIGEIDSTSEEVLVRTKAGVDGYPDDARITVGDDPEGQGPTGRAIRTGEMQVARNILENPDFEPWWDQAERYGFRSSAAIPITHEDTLYGVLNVYSERPYAFDDDERAVVGQLGEVIGHALTAIERKQALMSEEVVEIEFLVQGYLDGFDVEPPEEGSITYDRVVPLSGGRHVVYGTATGDAVDTVRALADRVSAWEDVTVVAERDGRTRFELELTESPVLSKVASRGGRMQRASVEGTELRAMVHLPPDADVRSVVDSMREAYPRARVIAQRRTQRSPEPRPDVQGLVDDKLTPRQRNALETAYFSGFFEWPRDSSGEEVAETLDVSAPTFHQHLRVAERKLMEAMFETEDASS
ncbi:bacterio-opsin activator domain-containing protein [Halorarum salinum]|uniref:PAS domain S-box protein n=1 Tax=Halorarum salinum TaxID=2743089 RepID=A0A7D5L9M9_9EURY|nr:bacterio-opsin activator domain-containing protein [Halobaculum salinum]QLG60955.1 PAS domain S-box protein [Halobaculum salinum]